jgi:hypothetical protein
MVEQSGIRAVESYGAGVYWTAWQNVKVQFRGDKIPHRRHWAKLAMMLGVKAGI